MQSMKTLVGLGLFIILFLGGLLIFYSFEPEVGEGNYSSSLPKVPETAEWGRAFEPSEIINQVTDFTGEPSVIFNDPSINQAWGLKKSDAARAWAMSLGSNEIVVAIIDTGLDIKHEDLSANLWTNPGESGVVDSLYCKTLRDPLSEKSCDKSRNGRDDDGNGLADDIHGWNFVSNNADLTDNHGHGTHIAGIIGAIGGNGKGIIGIAPKVSLMIIKYYDPKVASTDNLKNTIEGIKYAVAKGAKIINYSGGGTEYSQEEFEGVRAAEKNGVLFVAAAGNERSNSDQFHYYPADYKLKNIISVTAVDPGTEVLSSSNYGVETVDIAAPGQNILSTLPKNSYGYMTGTSQATAFVSGAAVLLMAHKKVSDAEEVKKYILSTGDLITSLLGRTKYARILNLYNMLAIKDVGVGASGVKAPNTLNLDREFLSETAEAPQSTEVFQFGRGIADALQKEITEKAAKISKAGSKGAPPPKAKEKQ